MAGLVINGSHVLGPSSSSSITTLPEYLASIGKDSFYARFIAGTNMWTGTALNGSAATLNGNVCSWGADPTNVSNFTAYWTQAGGTSVQPYYQAANSVNCLYAPTNNTTSLADLRHLQLSSTTALNGAYSFLMRLPLLERDNRTPYSHSSVFYFASSTGAGSLFSAVVAGGSTSADQVIHVVRNTPGTSSGNILVGMSQTGTGHNGTAPYLLRRSSTYSASAISELWVVPQLTASNLDAAMTFMT